MKNINDYKYVMIITSEDERYRNGKEDSVGLDFFADNPWEGAFVDVVFGNDFDELFENGKHEGRFYQTYDIKTGKRVGYGSLDPDTSREEIEEFEKEEEWIEIKKMRKKFGHFIYEGKEFVLIGQAYLSTDSVGNPCYTTGAFCVSDEESENGFRQMYIVTWKIKEDYNPEYMDEDMACDWNNPVNVKESFCTYYNIKENRFY